MTEKLVDRSVSKPKESMEVYTWTASKCMDLGIFLELGSMGAGHAATALSEVLQQPIAIEVPKVHTLPPHLVPKFYERHDRPTTAVYMQLNGESECDFLLLFEAEEAKKIAALMTMTPSPEEVDPTMEASAIEELANILIGCFLNAISDFTGIKLVPTPPQRTVDTFDAILDSFLVKQSLVSDLAIIFDTHFKRVDGSASGVFMLFPSKELQNMLIEKARQWVDSDSSKTDEPKIVCPSDDSINIVAVTDTENKTV